MKAPELVEKELARRATAASGGMEEDQPDMLVTPPAVGLSLSTVHFQAFTKQRCGNMVK